MTTTTRILVIDSFPTWRHFIKTFLELTPEWQFVGEASNGIQAEQIVRELQPDVVLLDVDLPLLNGIELARRLYISYPNIKLVFVTTETSEEMAQFALSAGAFGYVLKSSVVADLIPALAAALSNKRFISKAVLK